MKKGGKLYSRGKIKAEEVAVDGVRILALFDGGREVEYVLVIMPISLLEINCLKFPTKEGFPSIDINACVLSSSNFSALCTDHVTRGYTKLTYIIRVVS